MSLLLSPKMQSFDWGGFRHRPGPSGTITGGYAATREHAFSAAMPRKLSACPADQETEYEGGGAQSESTNRCRL